MDQTDQKYYQLCSRHASFYFRALQHERIGLVVLKLHTECDTEKDEKERQKYCQDVQIPWWRS